MAASRIGVQSLRTLADARDMPGTRTLVDCRRASPAERGFTIVEMIVVLVIIAIVSSFAVMSLRGARGSGGRVELRAAASMYADAVERYQADHGRLVPTPGSADWPQAAAGPVKRLQIGSTVVRPYLRKSVPDVMTRSGPAGARWAPAPPRRGTTGGTLVFQAQGRYSFRIRAYWDGAELCSAGDVRSGTGNAC